MTQFFVGVANPSEAEQALVGGADWLDVLGPIAPIRALGQRSANARLMASAANARQIKKNLAQNVDLIVCPLAVAIAAAPFTRAKQARCAVVFHARDPFDPANWLKLRDAGVTAIFLQSPGERLLAHKSIAEIADFVEAGARNGLQIGLAGRLQAPDIPRLLALKPDFLGVRGALIAHHGGLDGRELKLFRALIPRQEEAVLRMEDAETDVVFVRDYVAAISIGAYAHERGEKQRVRFNVAAEVGRRPREDDDFANLFSYDVITDAIARLTENNHFALVETLAERLAQAALADPHVVGVVVEIEKLDVIKGSVGVKIARRKK